MITPEIQSIGGLYDYLAYRLHKGAHVGDKPHQMREAGDEWSPVEIRNVVFDYLIPPTSAKLQKEVKPNLPWAEMHFQERVSGQPLNPPPSHEVWPFAVQGNEEHLINGKFSHTYPERMWPKQAGLSSWRAVPMTGIRFMPGDLNDLVDLLVAHPHTRQAYLPIWFPEDLTAAREGQRVPCTLGYHFLLRDGKLNMTYFIRSCDLIRYFRDDVYMACRLVQWVLAACGWGERQPGTLTMHIVSLHCFEGDLPNLLPQRNRSAANRT